MECKQCNDVKNYCANCWNDKDHKYSENDKCDICNLPVMYDNNEVKYNKEGEFVCANCQ